MPSRNRNNYITETKKKSFSFKFDRENKYFITNLDLSYFLSNF